MKIDLVRKNLQARIKSSDREEISTIVEQIIQEALDKWIVDKIIDYSDYDGDIPTGNLTWFIKLLNDDESNKLKELTDIKKAYLRILRNAETERRIGVMRGSMVLRKLNDLGFQVSDVPYISDKTDEFFRTENDELIPWVCLIPEFELTEEYKKGLEEQDRKHWEKQLILMRAAENEDNESDADE